MRRNTPHERGPERVPNIPPDIRQKLDRLAASGYMAYVAPLRTLLAGRTVVGSTTGHSGYMLELDNGSYLAAYLDQDALRWRHASGKPTAADFALLASPLYADGSEPIPRDLPYASQRCDLAAEVRNAHGHTIETLSTGDDTFNPAFADGHELDAMIVTAADGRRALRVFWEQW